MKNNVELNKLHILLIRSYPQINVYQYILIPDISGYIYINGKLLKVDIL